MPEDNSTTRRWVGLEARLAQLLLKVGRALSNARSCPAVAPNSIVAASGVWECQTPAGTTKTRTRSSRSSALEPASSLLLTGPESEAPRRIPGERGAAPGPRDAAPTDFAARLPPCRSGRARDCSALAFRASRTPRPRPPNSAAGGGRLQAIGSMCIGFPFTASSRSVDTGLILRTGVDMGSLLLP